MARYTLIAQLVRINFSLFFRKLNHRYHYDIDAKLFYLKDGQCKHYFSNLQRGITLYKRGLKRRSDQLWRSYMLDRVSFCCDDIVIDCGANYGDLWLKLKDIIRADNYIAFEPGAGEFCSICRNAAEGRIFNSALADTDDVRSFFVNEQDADSSIIEPEHYSSVEQVNAVRLDTFLHQHSIDRVKLLKLEAEGFEPEVLHGARNSLSKIEYIAIDGGNERGRTREETFSRQTNLLISNGFRICSVNLAWGRALFKNMSK